MNFTPGNLVRVRGREWVVLPGSDPDFLHLRPLAGGSLETTAVYTHLEPVVSASFPWPEGEPGDYVSGRLLREAARLAIREGAGPLRSFARLAFEPRPYQLVPLLMALKLDPIRLLIADDVGIGKTIEALLAARELYDRGEVQRIAVLTPPHLAEQWQAEMASKFHLEAALVLANVASRLERGLSPGESLFEHYPIQVISTDYIKQERRRHEFLRSNPELVIVDEAHTCAAASTGSSQHRRHQLVAQLAQDPKRHLILVTATPHSGNEEAFRSLLGLLDPELAQDPENDSDASRRRLARHLVQRRRIDVADFATQTTFPAREAAEDTYQLSPAYDQFYQRVLSYTREQVRSGEAGSVQQRVKWWSALALLQAISSSPAAAFATLQNRSLVAEASDPEQADQWARSRILDQSDESSSEAPDTELGAELGDPQGDRTLSELARAALKLAGGHDRKLARGIEIVSQLVAAGFSPIVFCRFIRTAEYLGQALRERNLAAVEWVTGELAPDERQARIQELAQNPRRVLVATDCLSEGINLQENFDAVVHYDLSWNPTRHEQREGRVNRYGQKKAKIRVVTFYGQDNPVDGIVLEVLLRKHERIKNSLGISVPVPVRSEQVLEAVLEGLLLRGNTRQGILPGMEPITENLHLEWENQADQEKRSRTRFAQNALKPQDVLPELDAAQAAAGTPKDRESFFYLALQQAGASIGANPEGGFDLELKGAAPGLRESLNLPASCRVVFDQPQTGAIWLDRTHPALEGLARYVLDSALDPNQGRPVASRSGMIRTSAVPRRTTLLVVRIRHRIRVGERVLLAEESLPLAFRGQAQEPQWLTAPELEALLQAKPERNISPEEARHFLAGASRSQAEVVTALEAVARERAQAVAEAHRRVRFQGGAVRAEPILPVDVLGIYLLYPVGE